MGLASEFSAAIPPDAARLVWGTVVSIDPATGVIEVDIGGITQAAYWVADAAWAPSPGDGIAALRQGQELLVIGTRSRYLSPYGTVTATGASTVTVDVPGLGSKVLPFAVSYTPRTVGDVVHILWGGGPGYGVVAFKLSASPVAGSPAPTPPPPPKPPTTGTSTFQARSAGTYRSGKWRTDANGDVIQGTAPTYAGDNEGAWFYHGQISSSLAGATVTSAQIWLGRADGGVYASQDCHLYRVTNNVRPSGALTFGAGPHNVGLERGETGWFGFSTSIAQALVTSGGSVGIKGSPYMRMFGPTRDPRAGSLRITWKR